MLLKLSTPKPSFKASQSCDLQKAPQKAYGQGESDYFMKTKHGKKIPNPPQKVLHSLHFSNPFASNTAAVTNSMSSRIAAALPGHANSSCQPGRLLSSVRCRVPGPGTADGFWFGGKLVSVSGANGFTSSETLFELMFLQFQVFSRPFFRFLSPRPRSRLSFAPKTPNTSLPRGARSGCSWR